MDRPQRPIPPTPTPTPEGSQSVETPEDALRVFEARRARSYAIGLVGLCATGLAVVAWLGGDHTAQVVHGGALLITAASGAAYIAFLRDMRRWRLWHVQALAYVGIAANASGFWYWGPFSAYFAVVPVSGYAFSSGAGLRPMIGPLVATVATHAAVGVAAVRGWIDPTAWVLPAPAMDGAQQVVLLVVLQLVFLSAVLGGFDAYRIIRDVLDEYRGALRALAQRDAQLAEAHEAERAIRGGEGRYSGQALGRFTLGAILGRGAMGEVYAATDEAGAPCAVKVLAQHLHGNRDALERFHREARAIASLDAPNLVRMLDVAPPSAAIPFLAMERLEGEDLAAMIKARPVREIGEVVAILRAVAAGLDAAHEAGVVHRDLKPANLYAAKTERGVVWKVLDFGVAKVADEATLTGAQLVGTPGYMAPEQARGDALDRRADVYALGVVAYRLVTGRPAVVPPQGHHHDVPAMIHEVVYRMPPAPSSLVAVPAQVEAVLAIALAKTPGDRFARAGDFAAAFAEAASGVLPAVTLERAAAILRRTPWGNWIRGARRATAAG